MSTRKLGISLGAAALLLGMPTSYALAGQDDRPGKGKAPHQCEDGIDNDDDGLLDYAADGTGDPDCGSPRDNSEGSDEAEEPGDGEVPGGETPALPAELQAILDQVLAAIGGGGDEPGEEEPPTGEEPPAEEPGGPGLPPEVQAIVDGLTGAGEEPGDGEEPGEGEEPPAEEDPAAAAQAFVEGLLAQLPPPPA